MADKEDLTRFGVAFPSPLIEQFDQYIEEQGYKNRSEAFRVILFQNITATFCTTIRSGCGRHHCDGL